MRFFKTLVLYSCIAGAFYLAIGALFPATCSRPIAYAIGEVDPRFHVSTDQFLSSIQEAEAIWEKQIGKQLFSYDPHAAFSVNLMYDTRQQITDQAKVLSEHLASMSDEQKKAQRQYAEAFAAYTAAKNAYLQHAKDGTYDPSKLEEERMKANKLADVVNSLATKEGEIVQTYNANVQQFNQLYGKQREFDQGEYTGNAITIYEFTKNNDLKLVLEHELGHALGIGHVENPASIMYYMVNSKNLGATGLSHEDSDALMAQCKKTSFSVFLERFQEAFHTKKT